MSPGGITLALMMPIAGICATKFDPRVIIAIGFALTSFGLFHVTGIYYGIDFDHMVWFRVIQVVGIPLIFIPISTLNYVGVPQNKRNQVAGISNFLRNIGGAVGVSLLNNYLSRSGQVETTSLVSHAQHSNPFFMRQLSGMTQNFIAQGYGKAIASQKALAQFSQQISLQAGVLSFENAFWLMGLLVALLIPLPFIMKRPSKKEMKETAALH
jgi:DHA2 family multidrug resistance protein